MPQEAISGLWRSEDMVLLQLHMQREVAHDTVHALGELGAVQFRDLNENVSAFQRLFTNDIRRCEEAERRLRFFEEQLRKFKPRELEGIKAQSSLNLNETLDALEGKLESLENELKDLNNKYEDLVKGRNASKEYKAVLDQNPEFYRGQGGGDFLGDDSGARAGGLRHLVGVIATSRLVSFDRLVYRACRGNVYMRHVEIATPFEDPTTGESISKSVFVIFFSAQRAYDKIRKLCEGVEKATLYEYDLGNPQKVRDTAQKVEQDLDTLKMAIDGTEAVRDELLAKVRANFYEWKKTVIQEKSIYSILNLLSFKRETVVAECWAPQRDIEQIKEALHRAEQACGARVQTVVEILHSNQTPPTFFRVNKFTSTFQGIVDSYGVARYKEVNPATFTVVTFPFLFGVMYGDVGHGVCLTLFTAYLIWSEKNFLNRPLNEIFAMIFGGRYILILMGIFATYMGFLYNDMFAMMIQPFGSSFWVFPERAREECDPGYVVWYGRLSDDLHACKAAGTKAPYPIGVDPLWCETENKLELYNSLKMKMAVILGVVQMLLGLVLSLFNHIYYKDYKHIWFGFIPEVIFLCGTFGYMCLIIVIKWTTDWATEMGKNHTPPSLLETMTNFFLSPGGVTESNYLYGSPGAQNAVQTFLLLAAFLSTPLLLIPIPYIEWRHHKYQTLAEKEGSGSDHGEGAHGGGHGGGHGGHGNEPFDMSEVVIKQVIHTIEFVLGCVSNTASYLRLWALSLAHAQLSEVFWNFAWILPLELDKGSGVIVFVGWAVWAFATLAVLLIMESLSAFLHALRLHWVEFQNKFYLGDGTAFVPFDIRALIPKPYEVALLLEGNAE
eukprot:TRINITY_DN1053_c0_g1_i1.p1 TRINITY_DN1053_c0_g1~~TRINITY_DN1053_c0_g1_i1.p1  ORF type:complete len:851 (-),score=223.96 TRINITY_DN1053_c0_g1_i1:65-2578(-)